MPATCEWLTNPYDAVRDADHHVLWETLIARDSDAFAAADWSACDGDFAHDRFEGITAQGSLNPIDWELRYPTVDAYRDGWLEMAQQYLSLPFVGVTHRELLYKMQSFAKVEIRGERAIVWKQFRADEPLTNGKRYQICAQSVYRLHQIDGRWLIVGFVGYLPLEANAA